MNAVNLRAYFWLILSTVLLPAMFTITVGVLILVFYREAWDVAFGVLVLSFATAAFVGAMITVFLLRRTARLAQLQSDFVANMSHDFRTPLTSIRMFVDTLREGKVTDPAERDRCLTLLSQETERMEVLVSRVLTWRTIERGGRGYRPVAVDPAALISQALGPFRIDPDLDARLKVAVADGLGRVMADQMAMEEALRNLVENAFRYGGEGDVTVSARGDGEEVAFTVCDHGGAPLTRKERKAIFKRFYRAASNRKPGTGLGLAIVRHVAQAHGGSVEVEAGPGEAGNIFTLRLPVEPEASDQAAGASSRSLPAEGEDAGSTPPTKKTEGEP